MYQTIIEKAEAVTPEMIAYRRDFHKYAESGWLEMRTASIIARRLTELGYYEGNISGNFLGNTRNAVKAFQKQNNLEADGIIGEQTWNVLFNDSDVRGA